MQVTLIGDLWFLQVFLLEKKLDFLSQRAIPKTNIKKNQTFSANGLHKYRYIKTLTLHLDSETLCK